MQSERENPSVDTGAQVRGFPLSPQQRRIWALWEASPAACAKLRMAVSDGVDAARLERAINRVVESTEILRSSFRRAPGLRYPLQAPVEGQSAAWNADAFDLENGRVFRAAWLQDAQGGRSLVLSMPALCADRRSLLNLARAIAAAYDGRLADGESVPYRQFAAWQNQLQDTDDARDGHTFWRRLDVSALRDRGLPFGGRAAEGAPREMNLVRAEVPSDLARAVERMAAWGRTSLACIWLGAWAEVSRRLTNRSSLVVADVVEGRDHQMLSHTVGRLARRVPVQLNVQDRLSFIEWVKRVSDARNDCHEWADCFDWESLFGEGAGKTNATFGFEYEECQKSYPVCDGVLTVESRSFEADEVTVALHVERDERHTTVEVLFDPDRFAERDARRVLSHLLTLMRAATSDTAAPLRELPFMERDERVWLTQTLNATSQPSPPFECFHQWFGHAAASHPDKLAVTVMGSSLSYAELECRANRLAWHLQARGVRAEDRVALLAERSPEALIAILGIWKAGAVYVPLDPTHPRDRLATVLETASASAVLTQRRLIELLPPGSPPHLLLDESSALGSYPATPPQAPVGRDHLAYILFTSGSTGVPKGVMVRQGSLVNLVAGLQRAIYDGAAVESVSLNAPLSFDASIKQIATLALGSTLHWIPEHVRGDAQALLEHIERHRIDVFDCTPFQFRTLLDAGWCARDGHRARYVLLGGERIDGALLRTLQDERTVFFNLYGPTECTVDACVARIAIGMEEAVVGRPLSNVRAYVLDADLRPVPQGVTGELFVGGQGVARGYVGRTDLTATRFLPDPFGEPGSRMYRTGDLARHREDGSIVVTGRADRQIKLRGYRIELAEIEEALLRQPGVRDAAVIAADEGSAGMHLIAYFVATPGTALSAGDLRGALRRLLPEHMVPAKWVELAKLPLTSRGKLDQSQLPAPQAEESVVTRYVAPRNEIEKVIAHAWKEELNVERVGVQDNFFDLGGHSLSMARIHARLRAHFGRDISLVGMFRLPTVELLTRYFSGEEVLSDASLDRAIQRAARRRTANRRGEGAS